MGKVQVLGKAPAFRSVAVEEAEHHGIRRRVQRVRRMVSFAKAMAEK